MVTPEQAIETYTNVLLEVGGIPANRRFKVAGDRICLGHVVGPGDEDIQWCMLWRTPEEFIRAAKMLRVVGS